VEVEKFIGSPYGDLMEGTSDPDILVGGRGNDRIVGRSGEDVLLAGPGRDRILTRDAETDLIRGGPGHDRARVDRRDKVVSAQRVARRPFVSPWDG
jgi:Ca2+-binding RTX toxin-like protein